MQTLIESFSEFDLNPFMIFSCEGKLLHYNQEGEYLFSFVSPKDLYELALNYAPKSFGMRSSHINIRYDRYTFCALLVGYQDDERIALRLYKEMTNITNNFGKENLTLTNIFTLLELSKNSVLVNKGVLICELYDPTIPEMKLQVEKFLKLLNKIFAEYTDTKMIEIRVSLKIGKNILIEGKSYPVCNITISNRELSVKNGDIFYSLAKEANVLVIAKKGKTVIEFPIIS